MRYGIAALVIALVLAGCTEQAATTNSSSTASPKGSTITTTPAPGTVPQNAATAQRTFVIGQTPWLNDTNHGGEKYADKTVYVFVSAVDADRSIDAKAFRLWLPAKLPDWNQAGIQPLSGSKSDLFEYRLNAYGEREGRIQDGTYHNLPVTIPAGKSAMLTLSFSSFRTDERAPERLAVDGVGNLTVPDPRLIMDYYSYWSTSAP